MFDIGFLEILLILIIALLVIGPERMPEVARKIGQFTGKMRRFVNSMKEDSQVQETLRELHDSINLEEEKKQINSIGAELQSDLDVGFGGNKSSSEELDMTQFQRPFGGDVNQGGSQFNRAPAQPAAPKTEQTGDTQAAQSVASDNTIAEPAKTTPNADSIERPATAQPEQSAAKTSTETKS